MTARTGRRFAAERQVQRRRVTSTSSSFHADVDNLLIGQLERRVEWDALKSD